MSDTLIPMSGNGCSSLGLTSGDMNHVPNSAANSSGPNIGANSLVTDANSALCGGQLQRCPSFSNEGYTRLPTSPISFSSNFSGSVIDGCSTVQQNPSLAQIQKQGLSGATSQLTQQDLGSLMNAQKKPRVDGRHEDALQRQLIQQLLQGHEPIQAQGQQNMQLQAILQQQRLLQQQQRQRQQQQIIQSFSHMQRGPMGNLQQQHLQSQALQLSIPVKQTIDNGICYRKLMQYLYHKRHRPHDNTILYWRKFVSEYFALQAKKRWCLSLYENMGNHALGIFAQLAIDAWQCDICGSKSGKGFEATFEVLPRLLQIKFDGGVIDENLFLDMPHECRLPSGIMVLKFEKAVEETVYEHVHIIHEGQLRILFTPELKILLWEFCSRRHEEFLSRRLLAPQVNQLLQVAQKYQATIAGNNSSVVSHQDLQASCNMLAATGRQLVKTLDLQAVNDLGFSKRYFRCLQIAEVVSSMKDLIDYSLEQKIGAIDFFTESLKNYPRQAAVEIKKVKLEGQLSNHSLSGDPGSLDKDVKIPPGLNSYMNDNLSTSLFANSDHQGVHALNNYQNVLRNTMNMKQNVLQQEASSSLSKSLLQQEASSSLSKALLQQEATTSLSKSRNAHPMQFPGSGSSHPTDASNNNLPGQHQQQPPLDGCLPLQNNLNGPLVNQQMQQHVIHQMLQEMMNNSKETPQQSTAPRANTNLAAGDANGCDTMSMPTRIDTGSFRNALEMQNNATALRKDGTVAVPCRNDSFKSAATASIPSISGNSLNSRLELLENLDFAEVDQIAQEFIDGGMFDGDSW
ncbi:probable transcriptional regulator SLK2 isoform X1 [Zingiber officinale]|uniref:probable transcriptional regulator SLK2 isoform X1 n=1 Tax=Zingiber officinale TaxID=94328 RepID=UPI001C4C241D|nr:probable transcriptional regulator SLK2 isoform X1 [Zingiber officinale]XP_042420966.1 probable transcriptional regulator SLK2 isoform X1 [Zingiber officinale]XP_042420967.1 probable transcriptional regulator SLK2 isoform X1 [Zingiber officinale]